MNIFLFLTFHLLSLLSIYGQATKTENKLLSRQRRYLFFPKGAKFVYQFVDVKPLMKRVPRVIQWLNEFDFPYDLPSGPGEFIKFRQKHRQPRQLLEDFAESLDRYGFNGYACVEKAICEIRTLIPLGRKSLVRDLLSEIFKYLEIDERNNKFKNSCDISNFEDCSMSLLHILLEGLDRYYS